MFFRKHECFVYFTKNQSTTNKTDFLSQQENQTPLHVAARLGNSDIVMLLLQHGASVDAVTNDNYTALHIAAKEGQEEVAVILLDQGANIALQTKVEIFRNNTSA